MNSIIEVPGNVSRVFKTRHEALLQETAKIDLVQDTGMGGLIFNRLYDPSLIRHEFNYCTSNVAHLSESMSVLEKLEGFIAAIEELQIVDIGCGQGEFVNQLRGKGIDAYGYDPVLRFESEYLFPKYFELSDIVKFLCSSVLYTMRCVLPHIENPWNFLNQLVNTKFDEPKKYAYIEYQQAEWIVKNGVWQQISHDHVNLFTQADFYQKYEVINSGEFADSEWRWIIVTKSESASELISNPKVSITDINALMEKKNDLERIFKVEYPIAIYGAAGKGARLAHAISNSSLGRKDLVAVDRDLNRVGMFLECSGVVVKRLAFLKDTSQKERVIIVANPNHLGWLKGEIQGAKFLIL